MPSPLDLHINISQITDLQNALTDDVKSKLRRAAEQLAIQTHAHVVEQANAKLRSRLRPFLQNLTFGKVGDDVWAITVLRPGLWIEEGKPAGEMIDDLLKAKSAKTAKDGSRYVAVPFQHNKGQTYQTAGEAALIRTLKEALKEANIPYGKIERNLDGSPRVGLLHSLDIDTPHINDARTELTPRPHLKDDLGRVQGPQMYRQRQHPRPQGQEGPGGRPFLWGVRIYQRLLRDKDGQPLLDKQGLPRASRHIMTFRVASSKHKGTGKWMYPGIEGKRFLDEAFEWAMKEWDTKIAPSLLGDLLGETK